MPDLIVNISKGRFAELYNRVDTADPSTSRLFLIPIQANAVTDVTLRRCADFAAMITAGVTERTANGWNRKTLAAADLAALTVDNVNDRMPIDLPDQTWTAVNTDSVSDLVLCYSAVTSPTNAQLIPISVHDFVVNPTGGDVTAQINDIGRAS